MKIRASFLICAVLLLANLAAVPAHAQQNGLQNGVQRERREKFNSDQIERRDQRQPGMADGDLSRNQPGLGNPLQQQPERRTAPNVDPADEAQRIARERQLERRALLRRQINEARDLYPPTGKP